MKVLVNGCGAADCAYFLDEKCHAVSVEVIGENGKCGSFTRSVMLNAAPRFFSQITACWSVGCVNNRNAGCLLTSVDFESSGGAAVCQDYEKRPTLPLNE